MGRRYSRCQYESVAMYRTAGMRLVSNNLSLRPNLTTCFTHAGLIRSGINEPAAFVILISMNIRIDRTVRYAGVNR
jgi:hypothetical protein